MDNIAGTPVQDTEELLGSTGKQPVVEDTVEGLVRTREHPGDAEWAAGDNNVDPLQ